MSVLDDIIDGGFDPCSIEKAKRLRTGEEGGWVAQDRRDEGGELYFAAAGEGTSYGVSMGEGYGRAPAGAGAGAGMGMEEAFTFAASGHGVSGGVGGYVPDMALGTATGAPATFGTMTSQLIHGAVDIHVPGYATTPVLGADPSFITREYPVITGKPFHGPDGPDGAVKLINLMDFNARVKANLWDKWQAFFVGLQGGASTAKDAGNAALPDGGFLFDVSEGGRVSFADGQLAHFVMEFVKSGKAVDSCKGFWADFAGPLHRGGGFLIQRPWVDASVASLIQPRMIGAVVMGNINVEALWGAAVPSGTLVGFHLRPMLPWELDFSGNVPGTEGSDGLQASARLEGSNGPQASAARAWQTGARFLREVHDAAMKMHFASPQEAKTLTWDVVRQFADSLRLPPMYAPYTNAKKESFYDHQVLFSQHCGAVTNNMNPHPDTRWETEFKEAWNDLLNPERVTSEPYRDGAIRTELEADVEVVEMRDLYDYRGVDATEDGIRGLKHTLGWMNLQMSEDGDGGGGEDKMALPASACPFVAFANVVRSMGLAAIPLVRNRFPVSGDTFRFEVAEHAFEVTPDYANDVVEAIMSKAAPSGRELFPVSSSPGKLTMEEAKVIFTTVMEAYKQRLVDRKQDPATYKAKTLEVNRNAILEHPHPRPEKIGSVSRDKERRLKACVNQVSFLQSAVALRAFFVNVEMWLARGLCCKPPMKAVAETVLTSFLEQFGAAAATVNDLFNSEEKIAKCNRVQHFVERLKVVHEVALLTGNRGFSTPGMTGVESYVWAMLEAVMGLTSGNVVTVTDSDTQFNILKTCAVFAAVFTKVVNAMAALNAAQGIHAYCASEVRKGRGEYFISRGRTGALEVAHWLHSNPVCNVIADIKAAFPLTAFDAANAFLAQYNDTRESAAATVARYGLDYERKASKYICGCILTCLLPPQDNPGAQFSPLAGWNLFVTARRFQTFRLSEDVKGEDADFSDFVAKYIQAV